MTKHILKDKGEGYKERTTEGSREEERRIWQQLHAGKCMAGIKRYRLATFECRGCALCWLMFWLYTALCSCFSKLAGKLWRRPRGLLVICSGRLRRPRQGLGSIKPRINQHKAPCSKHKHVFMAKMVWRSWESTSFLVAVVIVGFVRPVCLDASDSSKTIKVV